MDEALERLLLRIGELDARICGIEHCKGNAVDNLDLAVSWDNGRCTASLEPLTATTGESGVVILKFYGPQIPSKWFIELPAALAANGITRIEVKSRGWWISDEPRPDVAWVVDHIACHTPGPLTGTESARRGEAFIGMRDSYTTGHFMASGFTTGAKIIRDAVLWHTDKSGYPSEEVIRAARSAGCLVAGPNVAHFAIGARAAGCGFAAVVVDPIPSG